MELDPSADTGNGNRPKLYDARAIRNALDNLGLDAEAQTVAAFVKDQFGLTVTEQLIEIVRLARRIDRGD